MTLATPHWFDIPGAQVGRRTLEEQMLGLQPAIEECRGKTVFDMGSAEGLIAMEFAKAGAKVSGVDYNVAMIETATRLAKALPESQRPRFRCFDLNDALTESTSARYDIVLALAVIHKLNDPGAAAEYAADRAASLLVVRLPEYQDGTSIRSKHTGVTRDVNKIIARRGFKLEATMKGPRREAVQYWRRPA